MKRRKVFENQYFWNVSHVDDLIKSYYIGVCGENLRHHARSLPPPSPCRWWWVASSLYSESCRVGGRWCMTPLIVLWGRRADTDALAEEEWYKKATYVVVFPKATIYRLYLLYKASCCSYCNKSIKPTLNTESLFCPRNGSSNGGVKHAVFMVYRETSFFPLFLSFLASARLACRRGVEGAKLQIFNGWLSTTINRPATRSLTVLLRKRAVATRPGRQVHLSKIQLQKEAQVKAAALEVVFFVKA